MCAPLFVWYIYILFFLHFYPFMRLFMHACMDGSMYACACVRSWALPLQSPPCTWLFEKTVCLAGIVNKKTDIFLLITHIVMQTS